MILPNTNELKMHADDLADFGKSLHNLNGMSKTLVNTAVVAIALIAALVFLPPILAPIV